MKYTDPIKLTLLILVPILYLLHQDAIKLISDRDLAQVALYLSVGVLAGGLIWLTIQERVFKKRIFIIFNSVYGIIMMTLFISDFRMPHDRDIMLWFYWHDEGVIVLLMILMVVLLTVIYKIGMKFTTAKRQISEN